MGVSPKWVRLIIGVAGLLSFAAFVALWISSYLACIYFESQRPNDDKIYAYSWQSQVTAGRTSAPSISPSPSSWNVGILERPEELEMENRPPFIFQRFENAFYVTAPHGFLALLSALVAYLALIFSWRFTMRTLLIAFVAVALLLGAITVSLQMPLR